VDGTLDTWFKREVLSHEAALMRYLRRVWPARDEVEDLRQEVYIRAYEAARRSRPAAVRPFLLTIARNLMADRQRRARIVSIEAVSDPDALNILVEEVSPERRVGAWQDLKRAIRALNQLPPKCREVVWLKRVEELPIKEIADRLRISVRTAENQVFRGMQALCATLFSDEQAHFKSEHRPDQTATERQHGE